MVDIFILNKALILTWMKRFVTDTDQKWKNVWRPGIGWQVLLSTGGHIESKLTRRCKNQLSKEELCSWNEFIEKTETPSDPVNVYNQPLWNKKNFQDNILASNGTNWE